MSLTAISPIDGRYREKVEELSEFFSESALIERRVFIEVDYLNELMVILDFPDRPIRISMDEEKCKRVKEIEKETNHDVKAVEYFIREQIPTEYHHLIHFGLTSQDINSLAVTLSVKNAWNSILEPKLRELRRDLNVIITETEEIVMMSRTHGQPAVPTTVGKELGVFNYRLNELSKNKFIFTTKFGGATGNFNAHVLAYPDIDWEYFAKQFLFNYGVSRQKMTTQIENYDNLCFFFDLVKRINVVLIDLCRDIWHYISIGYFKLRKVDWEIGSSTMPQKVNPINFENAEGNLQLSNTLLNFLSDKLPISRLQRDLTDSTVTRNIGVAFSHSLLAYKALIKGLRKLQPCPETIEKDLEDYSVLSEAIQILLRKEGSSDAYEVVKEHFRGQKVDKIKYEEILGEIIMSVESRQILEKLTPKTYVGNSMKTKN